MHLSKWKGEISKPVTYWCILLGAFPLTLYMCLHLTTCVCLRVYRHAQDNNVFTIL